MSKLQVSLGIIVDVISDEAKNAKLKGMTATQLRCQLFLSAKDELNNLTTHLECNFPFSNFNNAIFEHTIVERFISSRRRKILIDNGFLGICGAGYTINENALDSETIEKVYTLWENWFWSDDNYLK